MFLLRFVFTLDPGLFFFLFLGKPEGKSPEWCIVGAVLVFKLTLSCAYVCVLTQPHMAADFN